MRGQFLFLQLLQELYPKNPLPIQKLGSFCVVPKSGTTTPPYSTYCSRTISHRRRPLCTLRKQKANERSLSRIYMHMTLVYSHLRSRQSQCSTFGECQVRMVRTSEPPRQPAAPSDRASTTTTTGESSTTHSSSSSSSGSRTAEETIVLLLLLFNIIVIVIIIEKKESAAFGWFVVFCAGGERRG